eukprot:5980285-Prymnesium_polylepis.1
MYYRMCAADAGPARAVHAHACTCMCLCLTNASNPALHQVGCPYAQRVWLALELKRLDYQRVEIDLRSKPAWLLEISPLGRVPALLHDGLSVCESTVICEYLEDAFPDAPRLLPPQPHERAQQRQLIVRAEARTIPAGFRFLCYGEPQHERAWRGELRHLDGVLAVSGHAFFGGNAVGLADLTLAPFMERLDVALAAHRSGGLAAACAEERLPALRAWWDRAKSLPEYMRTSPNDDAAIAQVYEPESVRGQSYLRQ